MLSSNLGLQGPVVLVPISGEQRGEHSWEQLPGVSDGSSGSLEIEGGFWA